MEISSKSSWSIHTLIGTINFFWGYVWFFSDTVNGEQHTVTGWMSEEACGVNGKSRAGLYHFTNVVNSCSSCQSRIPNNIPIDAFPGCPCISPLIRNTNKTWTPTQTVTHHSILCRADKAVWRIYSFVSPIIQSFFPILRFLQKYFSLIIELFCPPVGAASTESDIRATARFSKVIQVFFLKCTNHFPFQEFCACPLLTCCLSSLVCLQFRVFTAPFHRVEFADFWLADQLNSLVVVLMDFEYLICFYIFELQWSSSKGLIPPGEVLIQIGQQLKGCSVEFWLEPFSDSQSCVNLWFTSNLPTDWYIPLNVCS